MIEVQNLFKSFGKVVAVDDVSLKANDGRITGLLGPNGAGKTTTLRTLYGLQKPDQGNAFIDGIDVTKDLVTAAKGMGIFPSNRKLDWSVRKCRESIPKSLALAFLLFAFVFVEFVQIRAQFF